MIFIGQRCLMDYSKFDHLDEEQIFDRDLEEKQKRPVWATLIEKNEVKKLEQLIAEGGIEVNQERYRGERTKWQSAGNFNDQSERGEYTVLGMAVCFNKPDVVEMLLRHGADSSQEIEVNGSKRALLSIAKSRNMKKIIRLLK